MYMLHIRTLVIFIDAPDKINILVDDCLSKADLPLPDVMHGTVLAQKWRSKTPRGSETGADPAFKTEIANAGTFSALKILKLDIHVLFNAAQPLCGKQR